MNKIIVLIILTIFSINSYGYIDTETRVNDQLRFNFLNKLKKENKYNCDLTKYQCLSKYTAEAKSIYPLRGNSYAKKKYSNFNKHEAFNKLKELAVIYEKVIDDTEPNKGIFGYIGKKEIEAEGWFIFSHVLKLDKNHPSWRDFYSDKNKKTAGHLPSPFIDENCNMLIKREKQLQVKIHNKCPAFN